MINVVLVDDHDLVRSGIKRLLDEAPGIKVIGEARTGEEALQLARNLKPNIMLMDIRMPGIGGMEATKKLLRVNPDIRIIILTSYDNDVFPMRLIQAGALGYLTKGASYEEMVRAIRSVNSGQRYISPEIAGRIALKSLSAEGGKSPFDILSERELQVLMMITNGSKVQEISKKLHLSPKTINSYRYRIFDKLNVRSDVELTHLAVRYGLIDAEKVEDA